MPTAVPLVVASFAEDPDLLEAGHIHNQRGPSSAVQCKYPAEVGRGTVADEHTCSVALDVSDEDGCVTAAATP